MSVWLSIKIHSFPRIFGLHFWSLPCNIKLTLSKFVCFSVANLSSVIGVSIRNLAMGKEKILLSSLHFVSTSWVLATPRRLTSVPTSCSPGFWGEWNCQCNRTLFIGLHNEMCIAILPELKWCLWGRWHVLWLIQSFLVHTRSLGNEEKALLRFQ